MKWKFFSLAILFFLPFAAITQNTYYDDGSMHRADEVTTPYECARIDSIVDFALTKVGARYKYGAMGPNMFDCSGFMYYTFKHFGITLHRSSRDQYTMGKAVKRDEIRKGDLVFFIRGKGVGHVGLVIEVDSNHKYSFVHASTYKTGVKIDNSSREGYARTFVGARRIIECDGENRPYVLPNEPLFATTDSVPLNDSTLLTNIPVSEPQQTVAPPPPPQPKTIYHKVKGGETLSSIGRKYGVRVNDLKKWNNLKSDFIREGQKLKIIKRG